MEVLIHPFSFRETLRHAGDEPPYPVPETGPAAAVLHRRLQRYLVEGGFPRRKARSRETARRCWPVMSTWSCCAT